MRTTIAFSKCTVAAACDYVVTGDSDLLRLGSCQSIEIVRVADLLDRLSAQQPEHTP